MVFISYLSNCIGNRISPRMLTVSIPERVEQERNNYLSLEVVKLRLSQEGQGHTPCSVPHLGMFLDWVYVNNIANTGP